MPHAPHPPHHTTLMQFCLLIRTAPVTWQAVSKQMNTRLRPNLITTQTNVLANSLLLLILLNIENSIDSYNRTSELKPYKLRNNNEIKLLAMLQHRGLPEDQEGRKITGRRKDSFVLFPGCEGKRLDEQPSFVTTAPMAVQCCCVKSANKA